MTMAWTTDLDWAKEVHIAALFAAFDARGVPLTPFVTHRSEYIEDRFPKKSPRVGLHPNFEPGSSHGLTVEAVAEHVGELWPSARGYRCHRYDNSEAIEQAMYDIGCQWNVNQFTEMQDLESWNMGRRWSTGWEDELWVRRHHPLDPTLLLDWLSEPGLHVLNVHPQWFGMNLVEYNDYRDAKRLDWEMEPIDGFGIREFVLGLLARIDRAECVYLDEVWVDSGQ